MWRPWPGRSTPSTTTARPVFLTYTVKGWGTRSDVTLAPEGGAHQSVGTPLTGLAQDGLAAFEPAFADELAVIMEWAFDYLQRDGEGDPDERTGLRDESGGSVYLSLSTKPLEQPGERADDAFRQGAIDGAYWPRPPGPNCEVVIACQGAVADEAVRAAGMIGEGRRGIGVLAVTSADLLNAGWTAAQDARARGNRAARSHVECLMGALPAHCGIVTVIDGHPATLSWLGSVAGHRTLPLGVEHFGQTGRIGDLYGHHGIDAQAIAEKVAGLTTGPRVHSVPEGGRIAEAMARAGPITGRRGSRHRPRRCSAPPTRPIAKETPAPSSRRAGARV